MFGLRESSPTVIKRGMALEPQRLGLQKYAFGDAIFEQHPKTTLSGALLWHHLEDR